MTNTITDTDRLSFLAENFVFEDIAARERFCIFSSGVLNLADELRNAVDARILAEKRRTVVINNLELEDLKARAAEADKLAALLQERDARIEYLQQFSQRGTEGEPASLHRAYGP